MNMRNRPSIRRRGSSPRLRLEPLESRDTPATVGGLDPSFDPDGKVTTTFGDTESGSGVAIQADGKVVVVGTSGNFFAVARYNPDGSLDDTFGAGGKVTIDMAGANEKATCVAIQDDGKIVVGGFSTIGGDDDFLVARLKTDGSPDTDFSTDGEREFNFAGGGTNNDQAFGITTQIIAGARKIVVVGSTDQGGGTGIDFGVLRLNDNGTLDISFSKTAGGTDIARAVAIDSANRIVVSGFSDGLGTNDFAVMRFPTAGGPALDPGFNGGAVQRVNFGANDQIRGMAIQPDDKIVVGGFSDAGAADFAVARLNADGTVDTATFNPTGAGAIGSAPGRFTFNFGALGIVEHANGVALQTDGKIVMAGFTALNGVVGNPNNFAIARVTADGKLDTSFDTDGLATVDFAGDDQGAGVAIDVNGRIVVAGSTSTGILPDFATARLIGTVEKGQRLAVGGSENGSALVFSPNLATAKYTTPAGATVNAFAGVTTNARTAVGDVNGDKVPDTVVVTGPGTAIRVSVISGVDNTTVLVAPFDPFGGNFDGGGFVTVADFDLDGRSEFVVTPDRGGGPRISIFSLTAGGTVQTRANFLTIEPDFRGGVRPGAGDINGDGVPDLAISAGFLGGPRIALIDGTKVFSIVGPLAADTDKLTPIDFFAFSPDLRDGAFVAVGDVNGDGFADLVFGAGDGGGPNVRVVSGQLVMTIGGEAAALAPLASFFSAGTVDSRGGVRVAVTDVDGDHRADVVTGSGKGQPARARMYLGKDVGGTTEPATFQDLDPFGGVVLDDGVHVG
jgi:uncharacterized delta-60 repeat protein